MKILIFLILMVDTIKVNNCSKDTYEFGVNEGQALPIIKGIIKTGLTVQRTRVTLPIPDCRKLIYVRVDVLNSFSPPYVTLDYKLKMVEIITYPHHRQNSAIYNIATKIIPIPTKICDAKDTEWK